MEIKGAGATILLMALRIRLSIPTFEWLAKRGTGVIQAEEGMRLAEQAPNMHYTPTWTCSI